MNLIVLVNLPLIESLGICRILVFSIHLATTQKQDGYTYVPGEGVQYVNVERGTTKPFHPSIFISIYLFQEYSLL